MVQRRRLKENVVHVNPGDVLVIHSRQPNRTEIKAQVIEADYKGSPLIRVRVEKASGEFSTQSHAINPERIIRVDRSLPRRHIKKSRHTSTKSRGVKNPR